MSFFDKKTWSGSIREAESLTHTLTSGSCSKTSTQSHLSCSACVGVHRHKQRERDVKSISKVLSAHLRRGLASTLEGTSIWLGSRESILDCAFIYLSGAETCPLLILLRSIQTDVFEFINICGCLMTDPMFIHLISSAPSLFNLKYLRFERAA